MNMKREYQVVVIGAGPSAIFSALTLSEAGIKDIAMFEKGKDIDERKRGRGMELLCENTKFSILVSSTFTEPFRDPIGYGKYIARLANLLGNGVIIQRLGDLLDGRRSTPERINRCITQPTLSSATPGDLSFVLSYRHLKSIIEMLEALDRITPGIHSRHTLLYGVEVKFYTNRMKLSPALETDIRNLFFIGDGAGITRGLMQASISGMMAAKKILKRIGKRNISL